MEPIHKKFTDTLMTKRLQTLQSIDEAVERLYHELEALGELDNTYIFYSSDHGYHLGQFGLVKGKAFPFDVDTKVPFIVRGPKIRGGSKFLQPVLNIDLAPTFLDIGGVALPDHMDGKSIVPLFHESDEVTVDPVPSWRQAFLIERGKMTSDRYEKIRASIPTSFENATRNASGIFLPRLTRQEILAVECLKAKFQDPCQPFQQRKCIKKKNGDWKMISCQQASLRSLLNEEKKQCDCQEKRLQRKFLDRHTSKKMRRKQFIHRNRRSAEEVDDVLKEIAAEEIDEVDIIMEDINDEINDLQDSIDEKDSPCSISQNQVNCNETVYVDKAAWRSTRTIVNQQIRRLRSQLYELKEIRSHLKAKRPNNTVFAEYPAQIDMDELDTDLTQIEDVVSSDTKVTDGKFCNCKFKRNRSLIRSLRRTRRQKMKLARLRRRLRRKQQKRSKGTKKYKDGLCSPDERLNCFSHNNEHWKTPPFWSDGNFCACTNSNTNTYSCVRNVNGTHNYLYCEFVSGTITYYNLKVDPYQLRNIYLTLSPEELNFMHRQLAVLKNQGVQHQKRHYSKQRSFIQRYGQFLPPMEAYDQMRF